VQQRADEIARLGGSVVVISFAPPQRVAQYQSRKNLPFPVLADPELAAYRAFGLELAGWRRFFRWRVVAQYLKLMLRGWIPHMPGEGENPYQLGGDFVVDACGRLTYAHRSADPADRPGAQELIDALAKSRDNDQ
jgi:hypothetical protein